MSTQTRMRSRMPSQRVRSVPDGGPGGMHSSDQDESNRMGTADMGAGKPGSLEAAGWKVGSVKDFLGLSEGAPQPPPRSLYPPRAAAPRKRARKSALRVRARNSRWPEPTTRPLPACVSGGAVGGVRGKIRVATRGQCTQQAAGLHVLRRRDGALPGAPGRLHQR